SELAKEDNIAALPTAAVPAIIFFKTCRLFGCLDIACNLNKANEKYGPFVKSYHISNGCSRFSFRSHVKEQTGKCHNKYYWNNKCGI
ncbi:MAG: hypothetical protein RLZZ316_2202, partial [Bacteroidota bacterium]